MVTSSLYFERSLPCGQKVCLNYFVSSSVVLKGLFISVVCCCGVFERTVITITVILFPGVALLSPQLGDVTDLPSYFGFVEEQFEQLKYQLSIELV